MYKTLSNEAQEENRRETKTKQLELKQHHLYSSISRDLCAIIKVLLPSDKALTVSNHTKSILYSLIELKTGNRPEKF